MQGVCGEVQHGRSCTACSAAQGSIRLPGRPQSYVIRCSVVEPALKRSRNFERAPALYGRKTISAAVSQTPFQHDGISRTNAASRKLVTAAGLQAALRRRLSATGQTQFAALRCAELTTKARDNLLPHPQAQDGDNPTNRARLDQALSDIPKPACGCLRALVAA